MLKLGPNSSINISPISSPVIVPELDPTPPPPPPPPPPPSQYKSKSPHKSRSPRKSISPYESKSPRKSRSPDAIEVSAVAVSKRTPGSIRVIPIIYPSSGGRHNKTINKVYSSNKKTRRYKKH